MKLKIIKRKQKQDKKCNHKKTVLTQDKEDFSKKPSETSPLLPSAGVSSCVRA